MTTKMRWACLPIMAAALLGALASCVSIPPQVVAQLRPAAPGEPNNFRKPKDE